jgi:hypothetical protein
MKKLNEIHFRKALQGIFVDIGYLVPLPPGIRSFDRVFSEGGK